ncbi:hypothetical protein CXF68_12285 [Tenacibaculum sp. Bg11-29]|uniref:hypothetical protein n=1 Tax=Tenacibaculum sp. Bg11-29 TaxID=2058306 RepID=UPI000C343371|nr:hypothetical protein [Tenacibaculum sp. Bg11-29]PKH51411.1 hypothetical protein CXF68_12285 [Tenacibaculum sp. Bg11-29]
MIESVKVEGVVYERIPYEGDFDEFLLENIHSSDIEEYAEYHLDMIKEDKMKPTCVTDYSEDDLLGALKESGWILIKPESLTEEIRIKELIDLDNL